MPNSDRNQTRARANIIERIGDPIRQRGTLGQDFFKVERHGASYIATFARYHAHGSHAVMRESTRLDDVLDYAFSKFVEVILAKDEVEIEDKLIMLNLIERGLPKDLAKRLADIAGQFDFSSQKPEHLREEISTLILKSVTLAFEHASAEAEPQIPLYSERDKERFPTAESYLREMYGERLGVEGDLTITALRKTDPDLVDQLQAEFAERRLELAELFPAASARSDAKLMRALGYIPTGEERRKALTVLARGGKPGSRGAYKGRTTAP